MKRHRHLTRSIAAMLLALLMTRSMSLFVCAESSSTIKARIDELKRQEEAISEQKQEARKQREANESEILDMVDKKNQIDRQMILTCDAIETKNELIREYNLLIAEKQNELGDAISERDALNERYRLRIRSMEENGKLSYLSILFRANSFSDLLDRVELINEIASADAKMIDRLQKTAQQIETVRQELAAEKLEMEAAKESLAAEEQELEAQRAEADDLMAELMADHEKFAAVEQEFEQAEEALLAQISAEQTKYWQAVTEEKNAATSTTGFSWPTAARCVTSPFGFRYDPITGEATTHSGIDIGAGYGAPIYACASGTVSVSTYSSIFGNYVTINHGNGFTTLYGHMIRYTVSAGDSVSKGEIIGYVGSTGYSTGPHLHLTFYKYGAVVNPLSYLPSGWYYA